MNVLKTLLVVISSFFLLQNIFGQGNLEESKKAYTLCFNEIKDNPQKSVETCSKYLKDYPNADQYSKEVATRWIATYSKILSYLDSIKGFSVSDKNQSWMIYKPDLKHKIPIVNEKDAKHPVEISREFGSKKKEKYLAKAESVYQSTQQIAADLFKNWTYWSQSVGLLPQGKMLWSHGYVDSVLSTKVVTTSAAIYYFNTSHKPKENNLDEKNNRAYKFYKTNFKYWSSIKKFDKYEHGGKVFDSVYVADMNLTWGHICGGRCGYGFTRNKIVVLDEKGRVLDMFLDAQVNSGTWIS